MESEVLQKLITLMVAKWQCLSLLQMVIFNYSFFNELKKNSETVVGLHRVPALTLHPDYHTHFQEQSAVIRWGSDG